MKHGDNTKEKKAKLSVEYLLLDVPVTSVRKLCPLMFLFSV